MRVCLNKVYINKKVNIYLFYTPMLGGGEFYGKETR
jgi:hypothetical protein